MHVSVFRSKSLHLALTRNNIMMAVVELIDQHYGDVTALSMKVCCFGSISGRIGRVVIRTWAGSLFECAVGTDEVVLGVGGTIL